ncbi:MAG TPA: type II secretion system F family protein, partial [Gemmatimonadales bacterium]|nr:type II secretion system F family protein [Gemmatimonadales bacterium]
MGMFEYTAKHGSTGQILKGTMDVPTRDEVIAFIRKNRMILVSVREAPTQVRLPAMRKKVSTRDVVIFTRQFATMINAGLPLVQSLNILAQQAENKTLKDITRAVVYDVEAGNTLADAMRKHPKAFTDLYVNMVAAGEAGGILDTILLRLATFLEKNDALVRKVKGAMVYPAVIMSVAVIAVAVLLLAVIPTFSSMFASVNMELPLPTRIVMGASQFLLRFWWALIAGAVLLGFAGRAYYRTPNGRRVVDGAMLRGPILGDLLRKSAVSRFTRTLGTLISSGVSILDGLEITAKTAGNAIIEDAIMFVRKGVETGLTIAQPLKETNIFPSMVV